jgi:hypothetical protein
LVDVAKRGDRVVALATFSTQLRPEQSNDEKARAAVSALVYMPNMSPDGLLVGYGRYNDIIRSMAREQGVQLIDGENSIPGDGVNFVDTVHFTDAGSRKMAERVFNALIQSPAFERLVAARRAN